MSKSMVPAVCPDSLGLQLPPSSDLRAGRALDSPRPIESWEVRLEVEGGGGSAFRRSTGLGSAWREKIGTPMPGTVGSAWKAKAFSGRGRRAGGRHRGTRTQEREMKTATPRSPTCNWFYFVIKMRSYKFYRNYF